ncbi:helix-turn-helix transcriptional regulator [Agarivorans sp. MS3-6]|uniref:helix-turn-helix transcriptional regulator n=1 Tax=Agarivorans sp. TSD2052 TaxID=2937286 RepID=UPI00200CD1AB|nr:LuxR C-terminal-related transcriptional regulator [Agarivorans sp. TSD2052]UPW17263.1 LuxR C-terminal-related transcriptional regulator [Agarivorans sp. TSD2052]
MLKASLIQSPLIEHRHRAVFCVNSLSGLADALLKKVAIEGVVLLVLDQTGLPIFNYSRGFTEQQLLCYQQHRADDVYINDYLQQPSLWGSLQYLQQRLPLRKIDNPVFLEVIYPSVSFNHTLSGFRSLAYGHRLLLSCHREHRFSVNEQYDMQSLFSLLTDWANQQLSLYHMQQSLLRCRDVNVAMEALTETEWQVLLLLIEGYDGAEIACLRNKSKETIRSQIKSLLRKTGSRNQNQLIARYFTEPHLFQG